MNKIFLTSFSLIILDQVSKFWVKTHMFLGQEFKILDWFIIHFTENNGMAFGIEFGGDTGKLLLTIFRIIVVLIGIYYVKHIITFKHSNGVLISIGLIIGGAIGNIIDSVFYGALFSNSYGAIAEFLPIAGGYSSLLHGKVVDMLYFPLINSHYPSWLPILGGEHFIFFKPVFNLADSGISIGIFSLILFYRNQFK